MPLYTKNPFTAANREGILIIYFCTELNKASSYKQLLLGLQHSPNPRTIVQILDLSMFGLFSRVSAKSRFSERRNQSCGIHWRRLASSSSPKPTRKSFPARGPLTDWPQGWWFCGECVRLRKAEPAIPPRQWQIAADRAGRPKSDNGAHDMHRSPSFSSGKTFRYDGRHDTEKFSGRERLQLLFFRYLAEP